MLNCRESCKPFSINDMNRLASHITTANWKEQPTICWETDLCTDQNNYPSFQLNGKRVASRVIFEMFYNIEPGKSLVLHTCDNPKCINPHHLYLGDQLQNMADRKKRTGYSVGENAKTAILKDQDVHNILNGILNGRFITISNIAEIYSVNRATIEAILNKKTWQIITDGYDLDLIKNKVSNDTVRQQIAANFRGEESPNHKLTEDKVRQIKILLTQNVSLCKISKIFNVSRPTIAMIRDQKTWKHVTI